MQVRREGDRIKIDGLVLTMYQSIRLTQILRNAAEHELDEDTVKEFRRIARLIVQNSGGPYAYKQRIKRPKDDDEVAVQRVLRGERPFPVLSHADARRVFVELNQRGKTARFIAECLYVDRATITRWRRERRKGKWEGRYE